MQFTQLSGHSADTQDLATITRTNAARCAKQVKIADLLCRLAEELLFSTDQPTISACRTAGMMLALAYNLVPRCTRTGFDSQQSDSLRNGNSAKPTMFPIKI